MNLPSPAGEGNGNWTAAGESNPIALPLHLGKEPRLQRGMEAAAVLILGSHIALVGCRGIEPLTVATPGLGERGRVYSAAGSKQPGRASAIDCRED